MPRAHSHVDLVAALQGVASGALSRTTRALVIERARRALMRSSTAELPTTVTLVVGQSVEDEPRGSRTWVHSVHLCAADGAAEAARLAALLRSASARLGNPHAVALTLAEGEALREALVAEDPNIEVGRNGVIWKAESQPLRASRATGHQAGP